MFAEIEIPSRDLDCGDVSRPDPGYVSRAGKNSSTGVMAMATVTCGILSRSN